MFVTINNPDDPMGPPSFEGQDTEAHRTLAPGEYPTTHPDVAVQVTDGDSYATRPSMDLLAAQGPAMPVVPPPNDVDAEGLGLQ